MLCKEYLHFCTVKHSVALLEVVNYLENTMCSLISPLKNYCLFCKKGADCLIL